MNKKINKNNIIIIILFKKSYNNIYIQFFQNGFNIIFFYEGV